jgi:hypothetical protein
LPEQLKIVKAHIVKIKIKMPRSFKTIKAIKIIKAK